MRSNTRLLIVEDDVDLQETLCELLGDEGFDVVGVCSGTAAIAELDAHGGQFEEVITDIDLGAGPDGWEVGRRARECVADMPVVYMSGGRNSGDHMSKGVANSIFVMKPFALSKLVEAHNVAVTRKHMFTGF